ncbi:MAG: hypothetical protein AAGC56_10755 [Pseudomonadota bacterium]
MHVRALSILGKIALAAAAVCAAGALGGCGFTPLYAENAAGDAARLRNVKLMSVNGPPSIGPVVEDAFNDRLAALPEAEAEYALFLDVDEAAQRLAVQSDGSVTRFNYFLRGSYVLTRIADGRTFKGSSEAVASFNVVTSQYSTLFAEETAREKAARNLYAGIEREILTQLADEREAARPERAFPERDIDLDRDRAR